MKRRREVSAKNSAPDGSLLNAVVHAALHFLKDLGRFGGTDFKDQQLAIRQAVSFVGMCSEELTASNQAAIKRFETISDLAKHGFKPHDHIPYRKAIKFITGQTRLDRAEAHYEAFCQIRLGLGPRMSPSELNAAIKKAEKEGFLALSAIGNAIILLLFGTIACWKSGVTRRKKSACINWRVRKGAHRATTGSDADKSPCEQGQKTPKVCQKQRNSSLSYLIAD